jgi:hypothetical protein
VLRTVASDRATCRSGTLLSPAEERDYCSGWVEIGAFASTQCDERRLRSGASSGPLAGVSRVGWGVCIVLDVVVDASKLVKVDNVQRVCEGLLGKTPSVVYGAEVGPVARSTAENAPFGREEMLDRFDDIKQSDGFWRLGKAVATLRSSGRYKQPLRDEFGKNSLQKTKRDIHRGRYLASFARFTAPVARQVNRGTNCIVAVLSKRYRHGCLREESYPSKTHSVQEVDEASRWESAGLMRFVPSLRYQRAVAENLEPEEQR